MKDIVKSLPDEVRKIKKLYDYNLAEICLTLKEYVPEIDLPLVLELDALKRRLSSCCFYSE